MSLATLERAIWAELKEVINNPNLKLKEMLDWTTGDIKPRDGETVVNCPKHGVFCAVATEKVMTKP